MAVSKTRRAFGAAAAFVGVGAAGMLMAAPANAAVTGVEITTPAGYGSVADRYGASCSYAVEVSVNNATPGDPVYYRVLDGEDVVVPGTATSKVPSGNTAGFTFAPEVPGTYTLQAIQSTGTPDWTSSAVKSTEAEVGTGINLDIPLDTGSLNIISPIPVSCIVL
ncbi:MULTISPECIES: hypothetical protein [Gordonia]|uniref:Ig-like domain repeat protein n=1 Tax=Gordonia aquimaris TaxID=2984863 RepID=A0A9X3D353_9ACTN|nr:MULTISPECIES: hypothetical protein [Gordonia]MCX2963995.1 hypothetical protein [Gordonia aquimaris]